MNRNKTIAQLRKLRQRREDHARGVVAAHRRSVNEARKDAETASQRLAEHVRQAVEEQDAAVSGLVDRVVKAAELHLAQSRYEASFAKAEHIKAQGEAAVLIRKQREVGLAEAQQHHLQSKKALMKLEKLTHQLEKRVAARRAATAELLDDERRPHTAQPHE